VLEKIKTVYRLLRQVVPA